MDYYMHQTGGNFVIRAAKIPDALNALVDFDKGANPVSPALSPVQQFAAVFIGWGWQTEVGENFGDVAGVSFVGEKLVDDDDLLRSIAKFVEPGSFIEMMGSDDCSWRWYFDGEDMVTHYGTMTFDDVKPKVVIHVRGGVAEVATCPDTVDIEIVDFDNLEAAA